MSALSFDPWAGLKPKTLPTRHLQSTEQGDAGLGALAGLGGVASPALKIAIHVKAGGPNKSNNITLVHPSVALPAIVPAEMVEAMAEVMMASPAYRITKRDKALEYFRANALTRLCATADPLTRDLLLQWGRHRTAKVALSNASK